MHVPAPSPHLQTPPCMCLPPPLTSRPLHACACPLPLPQVLPSGLSGLVGMVRNWTFTAFFCMSELWGDVCLGLLFWGLANDTTTLEDASTLYPLFGVGANVAQAFAGYVLKIVSSLPKAGGALAKESFTMELQYLMAVVMLFAIATLALHTHIDRSNSDKSAAVRRQQLAILAARLRQEAEAENSPDNGFGKLAVGVEGGAVAVQPPPAAAHGHHGVGGASGAAAVAAEAPPRPKKQSLRQIYSVLAQSVPIRCLVVMSLAMGLCSNLMEFAWKSHIRLLYPSPGEFTAFLGDVSTWQVRCVCVCGREGGGAGAGGQSPKASHMAAACRPWTLNPRRLNPKRRDG